MVLNVDLRSLNGHCLSMKAFLVAVTKTQIVHVSILLIFYSVIQVHSLQQNYFMNNEWKNKYNLMRIGSLQLEDKCSPKLELLNCGAHPKNMPRMSPYSSAMILSNVSVDSNCKENMEGVLMKWEVWLVVGHRENYIYSEKILEFTNQQNYFIEQGSLHYGVYKVKLQSSVVLLNKILSVDASCYFEMVRLPFQTVIAGGSKRLKFFKSPITFNIFALVIPDMCESNQVTGIITPLNIIYEWQCDSGDYFCSPFKTTKTFRTIMGPFVPFNEYKFSLKVQTVIKHFRYTTTINQQPEFQFIKMDAIVERLELSIECRMNCGGSVFKSNPQEIIFLEAKLGTTDFEEKHKDIIYHWNYTVMGSTNNTEDISEMREKATAKHVFIVKRNKLIENKKYVFSVSLGNSSSQAELIVETCSLPRSPNCTIFPNNGVRGETYFNINCSVPNQKQNFLTETFEFFNRYTNEETGRYLGLSTTGVLNMVLLTRDRLIVRTINVFGASFESVIDVKLRPSTRNLTGSYLKPGHHILGNYIYRIGLITAYSDYLHSRAFSPNLTVLLLTMLKDEETYIAEISGAMLLINTLNNIFHKPNVLNNIQYLGSRTILNVAKILYCVSRITKNTVEGPLVSSRYVMTTAIIQISNYILNCSSIILGSSAFKSYNTLRSEIHHYLHDSAFFIMDSLNDILTAVSLKVLISTKQINLYSRYIEVMLLNIGPQLEITNISPKTSHIFQNTTMNCLTKLLQFNIQIIVFKKMPFWWESRHGGEINTNIIDLKHKYGSDVILADETTKDGYTLDLDVVDDFEPLVINGSVKQPNPEDGPDINDFVVAVHRITPTVNSKSFVKFVGIEGNSTLRALMLQDQRPDFDYMNLNATVLTNKSSCLSLEMTESNNELFLYIGILPGKGVKIGETINYTFSLFTATCKVRRYESWMVGSKCKVTDKTNKNHVSCSCSILTVTIGGLIFVPPHDFNPFSDLPLFISASDYPLAIILIVTVIISYVIFLVWTCRKDMRNKKKVNLIVLEDNDERDTCGYLVGVFTGSRLGAGTTSKVGIMLLGEEGISRSHILKSELRPTLQANCDDWFLLYTRHHLGSLTNIIIWMDYSGCRPNWYCSKIFVCDLQKYDTDTFYVETWFGISVQSIHLKMVIECATYKKINNFNRIFSENIENGLRENHLWLSLLIRHPRSMVGNSQRLTIVFSSLLLTIGMSALIYSLTIPQTEDFAYYKISKETFIYGTFSGLMGSLFSFITLHFFKSSYKLVSCPADYHEHLDGETMYHLERQMTILVEDPSWLRKIKKIISYAKPCQVLPVQTNEGKLVGIKTNRKKIVFVILLCIAISVLNIHLTVTCGINFGEVKSVLWLTSIVIGMIQTVFVTLPIRILVISLMFVVSKTRYFPLTSHIVGTNQISQGNVRRKTYEDLSQFLTRRKTLFPTSYPLHVFRELDLQRKQVRITVLWSSLYVFGCLLFLAIVSWLILEFNLKEFNIINNTNCREIDTQESCQVSFYSRFENYYLFLNKIRLDILPVLYSTVWYNGASKTLKTESFPNSGWLGNQESRLIGPPRLRQIRVKNIDNCNTPKIMIDNSSHCFVELSAETEDKGNYGTGWVVDDWIDCQFDQTSWHFLDANQAKGAPIRTPSGYLCHGGGYILSLGGSKVDAMLVMRNIIDTKWIDIYTRVVLLEFTTYNANKDVFTSVTYFAEATPYGTVVTNQFVNSLKLSYLPFSGLVFLGYFVIFLLWVLILMNIMGTRNFLKNLWNLHELIILVWYLVSAIYYGLTLIEKREHEADIHKQGKDEYFHTQILTSEIIAMRDIISVLFCLVAFRMLRIIRFNADVRQYLHDLYSAIQGIVWIWVVLSMFVFVQWRLVMFLVVSPPGDSFKDVLVYQTDFKIIIYQYQDLHGKILAFLISLLTQIGMFSYVCSLTHHYRKGQLKRNPPQSAVDTSLNTHSRYSRLWESSYG